MGKRIIGLCETGHRKKSMECYLVSGLFCILFLNIIIANIIFITFFDRVVAHNLNCVTGSDLELSEKEELLNQYLKSELQKEMDIALKTLDYPPSQNFMLSKSTLEKSKVFKLIKSMPKGANLHLHDSAMASMSWVISKLTYTQNLWMRDLGKPLSFTWSETQPQDGEGE